MVFIVGEIGFIVVIKVNNKYLLCIVKNVSYWKNNNVIVGLEICLFF